LCARSIPEWHEGKRSRQRNGFLVLGVYSQGVFWLKSANSWSRSPFEDDFVTTRRHPERLSHVSDARLRQPKKGETPDDASFAGFADHFRTAQQGRAEFTRQASFKTVKFLGYAICLRAAAAVSVPALRPSDQIVPPRITGGDLRFFRWRHAPSVDCCSAERGVFFQPRTVMSLDLN
jgi:hypothetical protein